MNVFRLNFLNVSKYISIRMDLYSLIDILLHIEFDTNILSLIKKHWRYMGNTIYTNFKQNKRKIIFDLNLSIFII